MIKRFTKGIIACGIIAVICTGCAAKSNKSVSDNNTGDIVVSDALKEDGGTKNSNKTDKDDVSISKLPEETPEAVLSTDKPEVKEGYKTIKSNKKVVKYDTGVVVIGDTAYEQYNYVEDSSKKYIKAVNNIAKKMGKDVNVYDMIVPTSIGITLPDNKYNKVGSSDQKKSIQKMYDMLSDSVKTVDIYDELMQHRTEYIYYRTDHHWTSLGAYYAYDAFCKVKEMMPNKLEDYKKASFGTFKGAFYGETNNAKSLRADKTEVLYPVNNEKISIKYTTESGETLKGKVIEDASSFSESLKYVAYIDGDNPYTVIRNKNIKDGSSCVVIKESFGNAFVPFLADHYSKIYVIDYRYWQGSISKLVKDKSATDVVFINNISMTRNAYLIGKLSQLVEG